MQVVGDRTWQWRSPVVVTAVASTAQYVALGLEYRDCAVVQLKRCPQSPLSSPAEPQEPLPDEESAAPVELHGHCERITSVRMHSVAGSDAPVLVCSASSDAIILWRMYDLHRIAKSIVVDRPATAPACIAFDRTGTLLAVTCDRIVEVYVLQSREVFVTLEGHLARVTVCEFHPIRPHLLFTCSEDRTFKIWDLAAKKLLFQSAVLSAFSIVSMAMNPMTGDASFGFADGVIKTFAVSESHARELVSVDIETHVRKIARSKQHQEFVQEVLRESPNVISSLPPWARSERAQETAQRQAIVSNTVPVPSYSSANGNMDALQMATSAAEISSPILALRYLCVDIPTDSSRDTEDDCRRTFNAHEEHDLIGHEQLLVVGIPGSLLVVNALSYKISLLHDFQQPHSRDQVPVSMAKEFCFHRDAAGSRSLTCGVVSAFQPWVTLVCTTVGQASEPSSSTNQAGEYSGIVPAPVDCDAGQSNSSRLSVIASNPPPGNSVLNLPALSTLRTKTIDNSNSKKKGKSPDKPITFRMRVQSSGYGSDLPFAVKRKMAIRDRKTTPRPAASVDAFLKEYPTQCRLLQHFQQQHALPPRTLHAGAIHSIEFSPDAKWLATSGSDKVAQVCRLPFSRSKGEGNVFAGHDHAVKSIHWSSNNQMVLTTSSDRSSRIWLADSDVASLVFHGVTAAKNSNPDSQRSMSFSSAKKVTKPDMVDAMFFFMDKFVLSACGNAVRLHQFELDELYAHAVKKKSGKKNDIQIEDNKSRKRKVAEWAFNDMQSLTSLACVNGSFLSSLVIAAGSDRSLRILDAAVGRTVRVISEAHTRAAHSVVLPRASCFVSHASNLYDLLLSSAPNSMIHLWDIRADNCVMRFSEHVNRVHPIGMTFSPCMRYVATGSEDRQTYMYDIRTGRCLAKLAGHSDVVTAVAFNPLYPQLATASYDGTVRFYSDE